MLDLTHGFLGKMCLQEGSHIEPFPPAVQNQAAGISARFLPAITEGHFVADSAATQEEVQVMFVQHSPILGEFRGRNPRLVPTGQGEQRSGKADHN